MWVRGLLGALILRTGAILLVMGLAIRPVTAEDEFAKNGSPYGLRDHWRSPDR